MSTRTPPNHCPHCGYRVDACTAADGRRVSPKENDLTICICCRGVALFRADLTLRLPTDSEVAKIRATLAELKL